MSEQTEAPTAIPRDARKWAMLCHIMALVGLLGNGIGFVLGPLLIWMIKKEDHPFVNEQGKEAVNFQITMMLIAIACGLLAFVVIGLLLLPIVLIVAVVFSVIGAIKANEGEHYRYPFSWRLIK
jgi:uncharacterized Tic20 family protein